MGIIAQSNVAVGGRIYMAGERIPDDLAWQINMPAVLGDQTAPDAPEGLVRPTVADAADQTDGDGGAADTATVPDGQSEATGEPVVPAKAKKIVDVLEWVGNDLARAEAALEQEKADKTPRVQLVDALNDRIVSLSNAAAAADLVGGGDLEGPDPDND